MNDLINVVLVEDEEHLQKLMVDKLLGDVGVKEVVCKNSPEEFMTYMSTTENQKRTHLILLDMNLKSSLTGLDLLQWLKDHEYLKDIPTCIITGSTDGSEMEKAKKLGAEIYLRKPLDFSLLKHVLYELPMFKTLLCLS